MLMVSMRVPFLSSVSCIFAGGSPGRRPLWSPTQDVFGLWLWVLRQLLPAEDSHDKMCLANTLFVGRPVLVEDVSDAPTPCPKTRHSQLRVKGCPSVSRGHSLAFTGGGRIERAFGS